MKMFFWILSLLWITFEAWNPTNAAVEPQFEIPHRGCYYTNWSQYRKGKGKFTVADINPGLCTFIVVAFGKVENETLHALEWNDEDTFRQLVGLKAINRGLKIFLSVGGWTLSHQLVTVSSSEESRRTFVASAVLNLRRWELDGLDVDWEYPDTNLKPQYSALLLDLREAFEQDARQSRKPRLILAAAVHFTSNGGYDGKILNQTLDLLNIMTYDVHGAWVPDKTGHHAPLFRGPFGSEAAESVAAIMKSWELLGIPKHKLILGLPMYGRGWMLSSSFEHGLSAKAKGPIPASKYTSEAGTWPYYEICERFRSDNATYVFDKEIQAAYAFTKDYWIGYDDRLTIAAKTKWAKTHGYGGVYIWDLAQDDFQGICGVGKYPLLNVIREIIGSTRVIGQEHDLAPVKTSRGRETFHVTSTQFPPSRRLVTPLVPRRFTNELVPAPRHTTSALMANGQQFIPKSVGRQACDKNFCAWTGPGSFPIGKCEAKYCDCDAGNNPYSRECSGGLVYDSTNRYCNWQETVEGCARYNGEVPEALAEPRFLS